MGGAARGFKDGFCHHGFSATVYAAVCVTIPASHVAVVADIDNQPLKNTGINFLILEGVGHGELVIDGVIRILRQVRVL